MRLLRPKADGKFGLVEFFGEEIPPYAILSHTWGADDEEVSFRDILNDVGTDKLGYRKIQFCAEQAKKDHLMFCWVDSCCIDKSSSAELTEAINSMFRWYQNAAVCYAYLSDISIGSTTRNDRSARRARRQTIQSSRWFTRSWTLQELLAPASVEFFSKEGERLGDRETLENEIHDATGISVKALQRVPLSQFSVTERLSWAKNRKAKREEDTAYSLLGIFDVQMPLLYGEGWKKAFARLQREIDQSSGSSVSNFYECTKQFNSFGGSQVNNTGSGNQFFGSSFNGSVKFG